MQGNNNTSALLQVNEQLNSKSPVPKQNLAKGLLLVSQNWTVTLNKTRKSQYKYEINS